MLNKIKEQLIRKNIRGVNIDIYVYPDNSYTIVPFGRSLTNEWVGARALDYKQKGNICSDSDKEFSEKVYNALLVCSNYKEMGINPKDNVESSFTEEGKKIGFKGYKYLSVLLLATTNTLKINELKPVDKKGSEWQGKSDTAVSISIDECPSVYEMIKKYIDTHNR